MATLATSATNQFNELHEKIVEKSYGNMGIAKMILDSLKHNQDLFSFIMRHEVSDMQTFYQIYKFCNENIEHFEMKIKQFTLTSDIIQKLKEKGFEGLTVEEQFKIVAERDTQFQKKYPMINKLHVCSAQENDKRSCKLCGLLIRPWS